MARTRMKRTGNFLLVFFTVFIAYGESSFFELCKTGTPDEITRAIQGGARVEERTEQGATPLMWAALNNQNPEVLRVLLQAGARVDERTEGGVTPLMAAAAKNQNPEVIIVLLNAGADGTLKSEEGKTAFDYASTNEKIINTRAYWELNNARFKSK